ncbi:hypothetical protein GQ43DRAFT_25968 [Delitschia confertaspora ATCC 74209]|uniref:Uncharacterized protein n=1 Tax=Delitschia confertaspora ATCC 74209 TaxID=1513339 RepID=A0A9P4JUJ9_9PLEO|nr:hypothetical protein GQ43DRAFT_25968 [Delitschia confertaspora ATCC 74209]
MILYKRLLMFWPCVQQVRLVIAKAHGRETWPVPRGLYAATNVRHAPTRCPFIELGSRRCGCGGFVRLSPVAGCVEGHDAGTDDCVDGQRGDPFSLLALTYIQN